MTQSMLSDAISIVGLMGISVAVYKKRLIYTEPKRERKKVRETEGEIVRELDREADSKNDKEKK